MSVEVLTFAWCPDNADYHTEINGYKIYYSLRTGWHCSCKGFKFRKTCKHVLEADKKRCHFGEGALWGSPEESENGYCPECGQKLVGVKVGV